MGALTPAPSVTAAALIEDWVTIWQSEAAALPFDREAQEAAVRGAEAWAARARDAAALLARALEPAPGPAGADAAAWAAAAAAAPGTDGSSGRDAATDALLARVAELERRLAGLDGG